MRQIKNLSFKSKPAFAIIVDGECEFWYFQMLKRNERALRVDLKPEIPQKKKISEQFDKVIEYSKHYDRVFWIIDFDVISSESRVVKKGEKSALNEFKEYHKIIEAKYSNVTIIVNNPCLEFWFLLHFEQTGKYYDTCDSSSKQLKKYLPDYEKTQKYFTTQNNDIYLKLLKNKTTAIINAKKLGAFESENTSVALSEMFLILEDKLIKEVV